MLGDASSRQLTIISNVVIKATKQRSRGKTSSYRVERRLINKGNRMNLLPRPSDREKISCV